MLTVFCVALLVAPALCGVMTTDGNACVFPFLYEGEEYHNCIEGYQYSWCSVTYNYDQDGKWGYCVLPTPETVQSGSETTPEPETTPAPEITPAPETIPEPETTPEPVPESVPTTQRPPCVFPFKYKNTTQSDCVENGVLGAWCATTDNYDRDGKWRYCPTKPKQEPECVFPFIYKGEEYSECTAVDNYGKYWCATTKNYDEDKQWMVCEDFHPEVPTTTTPEPECVFPFIYKNVTHEKCTDEDNYGMFWCSLTSNFDKDQQYKGCPKPIYTKDGEQCAIPFVYRGVTYHKCTTKFNFGTPWCSLTYQYRGLHGNCDLN